MVDAQANPWGREFEPVPKQDTTQLAASTCDSVFAPGHTGPNTKRYLGDIATSRDTILQYFNDLAEPLFMSKLSHLFWELPYFGHDPIVDWFDSPPFRRILFKNSATSFQMPETSKTDNINSAAFLGFQISSVDYPGGDKPATR